MVLAENLLQRCVFYLMKNDVAVVIALSAWKDSDYLCRVD